MLRLAKKWKELQTKMDKLSETRTKEREVHQTGRRDNPHPSPHARQQVSNKSKSSFTVIFSQKY